MPELDPELPPLELLELELLEAPLEPLELLVEPELPPELEEAPELDEAPELLDEEDVDPELDEPELVVPLPSLGVAASRFSSVPPNPGDEAVEQPTATSAAHVAKPRQVNVR
jgi:hypothetical protein